MDTYRIRKLKREYVFLHDYYEQNRSLMKDQGVRCLFMSLMAVTTLDGMVRWRRGYDKARPSKGMPGDSLSLDAYELLASFNRILGKMYCEEVEAAIMGFNAIKSRDYAVGSKQDVLLLERELAHMQAIHPGRVLVFRDRNGERMAIGRNAERLFETFGWQTATIQVDDRLVTAMPIHPNDDIFLDGMRAIVCDTNANIGDIVFVDDMEFEMSYAQQAIDCFRQGLKEGKYVLSTGGLVYHAVNEGVNERVDFPFILLSREKIELYRSDASTYVLVEGRGWNVSRDNFVVVADTASYVNFLSDNQGGEDREDLLSDECRKEEQEKADAVFREYAEAKRDRPDEIVLMVNDRLAITFGKDAVRLAKALKLGLWFRTFNHKGCAVMPMVLIPVDMLESLSGDLRRIDVFRAEERVGVDNDMITGVPSFLNDGLVADLPFANAAVFKMKDGGYGVRARLEGMDLPVVRIDEDMAVFYLAQEEGIVKETCLNAILMRAYHGSKVISRRSFSS